MMRSPRWRQNRNMNTLAARYLCVLQNGLCCTSVRETSVYSLVVLVFRGAATFWILNTTYRL